MAKYETRVTGNFDEIADCLHQDVMGSAMSINLIDQSCFEAGTVRIVTRVYDKYYMRNSSRASLTVTLVGSGNDVMVSAIGAGGGQGALFSFSWGAEENFVSAVEQSMQRWESAGI